MQLTLADSWMSAIAGPLSVMVNSIEYLMPLAQVNVDTRTPGVHASRSGVKSGSHCSSHARHTLQLLGSTLESLTGQLD